jgi:hypothetical protein
LDWILTGTVDRTGSATLRTQLYFLKKKSKIGIRNPGCQSRCDINEDLKLEAWRLEDLKLGELKL